jgi:hypothetical protein
LKKLLAVLEDTGSKKVLNETIDEPILKETLLKNAT